MAECGHNDLHYLRGGRRGEQRGIFCRLCGATWRRTRIYGRGFTSHLLLVDEVQHDGVLDPCAARESHNLAAQPAQEVPPLPVVRPNEWCPRCNSYHFAPKPEEGQR